MGTNHLHTDVNIRLTDHLEIVDCGDVREYPRLLLYSSYVVFKPVYPCSNDPVR